MYAHFDTVSRLYEKEEEKKQRKSCYIMRKKMLAITSSFLVQHQTLRRAFLIDTTGSLPEKKSLMFALELLLWQLTSKRFCCCSFFPSLFVFVVLACFLILFGVGVHGLFHLPFCNNGKLHSTPEIRTTSLLRPHILRLVLVLSSNITLTIKPPCC